MSRLITSVRTTALVLIVGTFASSDALANETAQLSVRYHFLSWSEPVQDNTHGYGKYQISVHNTGNVPLSNLRLSMHVVTATPLKPEENLLEVGPLPVGLSVETQISVPVLRHEQSLLKTMPLRAATTAYMDIGGTTIRTPVFVKWEAVQ